MIAGCAAALNTETQAAVESMEAAHIHVWPSDQWL